MISIFGRTTPCLEVFPLCSGPKLVYPLVYTAKFVNRLTKRIAPAISPSSFKHVPPTETNIGVASSLTLALLPASWTCLCVVEEQLVSWLTSAAPTIIFNISIGYMVWNTPASSDSPRPAQISTAYMAPIDSSLVFAHFLSLPYRFID